MQLFRYLIVMALVTAACSPKKHAPLEQDGSAPAPVSNVQVQPVAGGAILRYTLPVVKEKDLLYVKALYESPKGNPREVKASFYNSELQIDGLGDTSVYDVKLYTVDRSENASTPVTAQVKPLLAPVQRAYASLTMEADFGGVELTYTNPDEGNIVISVLTKDIHGDWVTAEMHYTKAAQGRFGARGFDSTVRVFGAFVKDRWGNVSDTLVKTLKPIYEKLLDKSKFVKVVLTGDNTTSYNANMRIEKLWDNLLAEANSYQTATGSLIPTNFTFDLGVTTKLSRFLYNMRTTPDVVLWGHGNPRRFELWGTATTPNSNGDWASWTKIMDVESVKPSGLPVGQNTNEDRDLANRGEEFRVPLSAPSVRYLRIRVNQTWNNTNFMHIAEMTFWGN